MPAVNAARSSGLWVLEVMKDVTPFPAKLIAPRRAPRRGLDPYAAGLAEHRAAHRVANIQSCSRSPA